MSDRGQTIAQWNNEANDDVGFLREERTDRAVQASTTVADICPTPSGAFPDPRSEDHSLLVGISPQLDSVCHMVRRVAPTIATVLLIGESGVGKEMFARMLHRLSRRSAKPIVALNCAALPETLLESELFGVERGAYTGVLQSRKGRFERADGGTLFLDEVGTLSPGAQCKLLRVLQEGEIERLGDTHTRRVDVRVISATNVDLREEVAAGRFRDDLFYRLNVFPIRIPPLRERREDILPLMNHILARFNRRHGRRLDGFTPLAVDSMLAYDWPGNVREMENVIERGVILAGDVTALDTAQLFTSGEKFTERRCGSDRNGTPLMMGADAPDVCASEEFELEQMSRHVHTLLSGQGEDCFEKFSLDHIEAVLIEKAVERANGNVAAAARLLGITRPQMVYRLKHAGYRRANPPGLLR